MSAKTITLDVINGGPNFTTSPTVPTPAVGDASQAAAPTTFVTASVAVETAARTAAIASLSSTVAGLQTTLSGGAVLTANLGTAGNPFALDSNLRISGQSLGNNHSGYATVASLSAFPYATATNQDFVDVPCYATAGDNGGGRFIWLATSTSTVITGFVINPTGNTGAGRLVRMLVGTLRPEMAGGVGDNGTTDNSAAFTAINSFINANSRVIGQFVVEFNGFSYGTTVPWTPPSFTTPQNGKLLAMPGASWTTTNGVMIVSNGNVKPVNFTVDANFISGANGLYLTSTTGFSPNGLTVQRWATGCNGVINNGGKFNNAGPVIITQYISSDPGYTQPWTWSGCGVQNIGVADSKLQQFVISKCGRPFFFDETCSNNTISCCHPFNGVPGNPYVNSILVEDRGYGNIYVGNEFDNGSILLVINSSSHSQSPPTVNATFVANTFIFGNSIFPSLFRVRTSKNNTTITNLNIVASAIPTNTTMPNVSFELYGNTNAGTGTANASTSSTAVTLTAFTGTTPAIGMIAEGYNIPAGTTVASGVYPNLVLSNAVTLLANTVITFTVPTGGFASTLNTAAISAITGPFQLLGTNTNMLSNQNYGGFGSVLGNLSYQATLSDMGRATTPLDSYCSFFANSTNKPVVLSSTAPQGQKIVVNGGATSSIVNGNPVSAIVTTAQLYTTYQTGNTGNATVSSISFISGAPLGNYLITALTSTTYSVVDPNLVNLGTATAGTAFTSGEINLIIIAGTNASAAGDAMTVINNTGSATLNNVVGAFVTVALNSKWEFECINNGTGTSAIWVGINSNAAALTGRNISSSTTLLATDLNNSVLVNTANVIVSLPNFAPADSYVIITTTSAAGTTINTDASSKIQGSTTATLTIGSQTTVMAYVISNPGGAADWGFIGIPIINKRIITANTSLTSIDNSSVLPINNSTNNISITLSATQQSNFATDTCILGTGTVTFAVGSGGYLNGTLNGTAAFTNTGGTMMSLRVTMQYNPGGTAAYWFVK